MDVVAEIGRPGSIIRRSITATVRAIPKLLTKKYDLVFVGFYGYLLMFPIRLMTRSPILFDAFISTLDTLEDRKIAQKSKFISWAAYWLDKISCIMADRVLIDTEQYIDYFVNKFGFSREKFRAVPISCDEAIFTPDSGHSAPPKDEIIVLYFSTYLPLHGTDMVIKAAARLKDTRIQFRLAGNGSGREKAITLAQSLEADNVTFLPHIPLSEIASELQRASICLGGHYGPGEKPKRVVAGKAYQCIAMGKATIVGDNPANRGLLTHGYDAWFCEMDNAENLAQAIQTLACDEELRNRLGINARQTFLAKAGKDAVNRRVKDIVDQVLEEAALRRR